MPRASVTVKSNLEDGIKMATRLQDEIPDSADDAAKKIAKAWKQDAIRSLGRGGHTVSGTGIRSLGVQNMGEGKAGVWGAKYLKFVQTGTKPHYPNISNPRFKDAARSYGMSRFNLAQSIARKGTRPHDWIGPTNKRVRSKAPAKVKIELDQAIKQSIK